jgi:large subunit ribosomal protein L29
MKIKELKDLSREELKEKEKDLVEELFKLRFRHGTGQLDSPSAIKKVKRDIARVKTVLGEKEAEK